MVSEIAKPQEGESHVSSAAEAQSIARESMRLYEEWLKILWGTSDKQIPPKDPRFADPVWRDNPAYNRLAQSYLTFCDAVDSIVGENPDWRARERTRFLTGILTSAMAPTNTLWGNPTALREAFETGGMSLLRGMLNMLSDMVSNKGVPMPSQVNPNAFQVGGNLAITPGAVVHRSDMVELLQYQPTTAEMHEYPTLMIVPPVGKYYFMDLAPKRSFVEYAVSRGVPFFAVSWRNPGPEQGDWALDDYVKSCLECVEAVCAVTGSKKVNILGLCAGGIISTLMLSHMAATGDDRVNAAAFGVMLLDFDAEGPIAAFHSKPLLSLARWRSGSKGILPASNLANVFAWMRPNDLVWNYWCNNYLMGKDPPSFDILAWSVDGTNLPGALHAQFLDIFEHNVLVKPSDLKILGSNIDFKRIQIDTFVTAALTDHITPWKACYRTTQLLGGNSTFILSNAGHIASLVNPPENSKATYYTGGTPGPDPEEWLRGATKHVGTWWELWADWTQKRSGGQVAAPRALGTDRYPPLYAAPGEYVKVRA